MQLQSFDAEYLQQLKRGDPGTEQHFVSYFGSLLSLKLYARLRSRRMVEDIRQETLLRVLETIRHKDGVQHPERFGAFVNAVCNHVILEFWRAEARHDPGSGVVEPHDPTVDLDRTLVDDETKREVQQVLEELSPKDQQLLRAAYLEELDKREICRRYGVAADYLRVLLHRAKSRFRTAYQSHLAAARTGVEVQIDGVKRQVDSHHITHFDTDVAG